ncbi:MAG: insulinase family protein [Candidatus Eisenbacteria bacterium]|uniref:Insulinase family protein n=1 Tax=Eiseniibacteriota bacterium TaxID=2212470 RepID=A0A538UCW3_UNCEI|nr:MAG: insulinase family protein [Candidatus Eisenbacteria bacterium]
MSTPHRLAKRVLRFACAALAIIVAPRAGLAAPKAAAKPAAAPPRAAGIAVEEHFLSNGMKLLLIPRHLSPTVAGGWVAHVGSANERPGITGISHLFEHMMFKGTHAIGTRDYAKDERLIDAQEQIQDQMREELSKMRAAQRRGDLDDIAKPEAKTERYKQLEARFDSLVVEQRANMVKNEFDLTLSKNGGTGMNAFTNEDITFYFETVPANKLELWFWMESDRLKNRVFREFYSERDVVYEERRRSVESTPTGKFQVSFDAIFWEASPYHWPVIGWPSDVAAISKAQADEYYSLYYAPQNLTAILVGDFDPKQALAMAEKYLGSIPAGRKPAPEMITTETRQLAEKRFYGEAETNPAVTLRWHVPAEVHKDVPALEVLATVLSGTTGRLNRSIVLDQKLATNAFASNDARKYEGAFDIRAEAKEGHTPEELEQAIDRELDKLKQEPVPAEELQSVKNRYLAGAYRQLTSNFSVMLRYGVADGAGDWRLADQVDAAAQAVSPADLQRVATTYFTKENRAVAIWTRKGGSGPEDPALAALPDQAKPMVKQMLGRIASATDTGQLQQMLARLDQMSGQTPPEMKPALDYVRAKAEARMQQLDKK